MVFRCHYQEHGVFRSACSHFLGDDCGRKTDPEAEINLISALDLIKGLFGC